MIALPLTPDRAARLLLRAAVRAGRLRALWDPEQERDERGRWAPSGGGSYTQTVDKKLPVLQSGSVGDLTIPDFDDEYGPDVPNVSSISASLTDYEILDGIREVKLSEFQDNGKPSFYSVTEEKRVKELAERIRENKTITPLIIVYDGDPRGPYVLEGGHRFDALKIIGVKSFPAMVVIDKEDTHRRGAEFNPDQPRDEHGQWSEGSQEGSRVVFHGTSKERLDRILKEGLKRSEAGSVWSISKKDRVYLTNEQGSAEEWAQQAVNRARMKSPDETFTAALLRVRIPQTELKNLKIDENFKGINTRELEFHNDVRPEWIEEVQLGELDDETGRVKWRIAADVEATFYIAMILSDNNKRRDAEFNPDQPRDERGQWTDGRSSILSASPERRLDRVRDRSENVAREMGVNPAIIDVVDKEPREFRVGDQHFKEAGHYDPTTGTIEINARNSYDDRMSVTKGIAAHEVSHALYDAARAAQAAEHEEITNLPHDEYSKYFRASGYVRPEKLTEVHERWPVSAMFYRHTGDAFVETEEDQQGAGRYRRLIDKLEEDDGVTDYSRSYWERGPSGQSGGLERAINETLAETMRHKVVPASWTDSEPHDTWKAFAEDLRKTAALDKVKARIGRRK